MVTFQEYINIVGDDILENYGQEAIERVLVEAQTNVLDQIRTMGSRVFNLSRASAYELEIVKECIIEQASYILTTGGSVGNMSGYDPVSNTFVSLDEIQRRIISPNVKNKLKRTRWNYQGLW